jgi:hypothetical protein
MGRVCQEMASCMSRAKHLPLVRTNTARGCTADKGCRLVWKFTRELVGILVTSMSIFGLQALAVSQRKMFARGRDDYSAITTILHAILDLPLASTPLAFEGGLCGGLRVDKSARSRWWWNLVSLLPTVPEDKETTRHGAYGVGLVMLLPEQPVVFATKDNEAVVLALGYAETTRKPPPPEPPPDGP